MSSQIVSLLMVNFKRLYRNPNNIQDKQSNVQHINLKLFQTDLSLTSSVSAGAELAIRECADQFNNEVPKNFNSCKFLLFNPIGALSYFQIKNVCIALVMKG